MFSEDTRGGSGGSGADSAASRSPYRGSGNGNGGGNGAAATSAAAIAAAGPPPAALVSVAPLRGSRGGVAPPEGTAAESPRLLPLGALLADWDAHARELYEARISGRGEQGSGPRRRLAACRRSHSCC